MFLSQIGPAPLLVSHVFGAGGGLARSLWGFASVAYLAAGVTAWTLDKTSFDYRGIRFSRHCRRWQWQQLDRGWTTSTPSRRGQVAYEVSGAAKPVWITDPEGQTLQAWEASTGRQRASYGYYRSDNPPPYR